MKSNKNILLLITCVFLIFIFSARSIFKNDELVTEKNSFHISYIKLEDSKKINPIVNPIAPQISKTEVAIVDIHDLFNEVRQLKTCYTDECHLEKSDPRTEYYNLGQKIRLKLLDILEIISANKLIDTNISIFAREFIGSSDGHIQEVALDLMSTQPISRDNLESILNYIINGNDSELIEQGLLELRRYRSQEELEIIQRSLANAMIYGAPFVAQTIAQYSYLFIDNQNFDYFDLIIKQVDPESIVGSNLKTALQDFRRINY